MNSDTKAAAPIGHAELLPLIAAAQAGFAASALLEGERDAIVIATLQKTAREGIEARNRVIEANMRLVTKIAAPIATAVGLQDRLPDLVQAGVFGTRGNSGLAKAIEKFDPSRNKRFTTYATPWIRAAVRDAIDELQDVDVKGGRGAAWVRVRAIRDKLATELEREPTKREVKARCALMGVEAPSDRVLSRLELGRRFVEADPAEIASEQELANDIEIRDTFAAVRDFMVRELPSDDVRLITLRFGLDGGEPLTRPQLNEIFPGVEIDKWVARVLKRLRVAMRTADKVML